MTKVSKCFICGGEFAVTELDKHEKECLENITSNDVQYTREETKEIAPDAGNPQYETCHLCGKLYSKNSMDIHWKQCQQTRAKQKDIGTAADNKIKSRSLADVGEGKYTIARPPTNKQVSRIPIKHLNGTEQKENRSKSPVPRRLNSTKILSLSSSLDNLTVSRRKDMMYSDEVRSKNKKDERSPMKKGDFSINETNLNSSPGRQKCYLCKQMYGALSLPIHEKQCYAKQRRMKAVEDEDMSQQKKGGVSVNSFKRSK